MNKSQRAQRNERMRKMREEGASVMDICRKFKVSTTLVYKVVGDIPYERPTVQNDPRNEEMLELRIQGWTLQEIGDKYKITRERVRQVTDRLMDGSTAEIARKARQERMEAHEAEVFEHNEDLIIDLFQQPGVNFSYLAKQFDVRHEVMQQWLQVHVPEMVWRKKIAFRRPESIEIVDWGLWFQKFRDDHDGATPSISAWRKWKIEGKPEPLGAVWRYGSWNKACEEHGMIPNAAAKNRVYVRRFHSDDVMRAVKACMEDLNKLPTAREYEKWCKGHPDRPSLAIVGARIAGDDNGRVTWSTALEIVLGETNGAI